jgi:hypothetical protein
MCQPGLIIKITEASGKGPQKQTRPDFHGTPFAGCGARDAFMAISRKNASPPCRQTIVRRDIADCVFIAKSLF